MAEDLNTHPPEDLRPGEGAETLGGILATARERHGLTVGQMAAELRVESRLLEALEEDRFEALPAPVFVKGYLRHLASRYGLDYDDLLHRYTGQTDTQDAPVTYSEPIPEESRFLAPLLIGALVLVLGIPALWFTWAGRDLLSDIVSPDLEEPVPAPGQVEPVPEEAAALPDPGVAVGSAAQPSAFEPDPVEPSSGEFPPGNIPVPEDTSATEFDPEDAPAAVEPGPAEPPTEAFPTGDVSSPDEQPNETEVADPAPSGGQPPVGAVPGIEPQPQEIAPEPGAATLTEPVATEQADGPLMRVALSFEEECWTEVSDGNGNSLYYALASAGTTANLQGVPPLSFLLGNPGGVQLSINDQPWPIPPPGPGTTTANFVVDEAP
ncbi:MAG: DUF4115 domain-containing protein [Rhodospirillaceae bacterium]|nr:DUF4115 domain-containing protein [Rhodospirillaceae bacterium]